MSRDFYNASILPYSAIIIKLCRAYTNSQEDYEDYYQEVCLQIWKSKDNFKSKSEWSTWVYKIALNVCLSLLRKKKKVEYTNINSAEEYIDSEESKTNTSDKDILNLYQAIKNLSEINRGIILLYLEKKSYKEIATITGTNSNAIGVRITRIKNQLKKELL